MSESRNPPMTAHGGARFPSIPLLPRAGAGLKPEHVGAILADKDSVGFFEVHAENYMGKGGAPHAALSLIRQEYPLSVHGVGLSIGGSRPAGCRPPSASGCGRFAL